MRPLIKKYLSIFYTQVLPLSFSLLLSFILLLNAIGYYPLLKIKQWQVHEEMKTMIRTSLPEDKLQCITVTVGEHDKIQWEWEWEEEQEFTYEGNRYDVVRSSTVGTTTYYYCIQDTQETQLFAQLDEEVERTMDDQSNPLQQTAKKIMKTVSSLIHKTEDPCDCKSELVSKQYCATNANLYQYDFLNRISPPPKFV